MLNIARPTSHNHPTQPGPHGLDSVFETIGFTLSPEARRRDTRFAIEVIARALNIPNDSIALLVLDPQGKDLHFLSPEPMDRLHAKLPFTRFSAPASRALWERRVLIEDVILPSPRPEFIKLIKKRGGVSLCYPVVLDNCPLGVIQVTKTRTPTDTHFEGFDATHIKALKELESGISRCLQSARAQRFPKSASKTLK